jgi:hypothetical protein
MSFWGKVKDVLSVVAPTLGTALGGPLGGVAGVALKKALGHEKATDDELSSLILSASPEQIIELKKAEIEFQKFLEENEIEVERIHAQDRDSARKREAEVKDKTPSILAFGITGGYFGTLIYLLVNGLPATGSEPLLLMLGALTREVGTVFAYYFGSSAGSKHKTDALAEATKRG